MASLLMVAMRWLVAVMLLCSHALTAEKGGAVVVPATGGVFDLRLPLAGGIAGGFSNGILYPLDTIKTMQQSDPSIRGMKAAVVKVYRSADSLRVLYSGFWAAVVGSVPSSALYFGTYETAKKVLYSKVGGGAPNGVQRLSRPFIHMLAAASGNVMSSFVFVPKDAIKQQLQAIKTGSIPSLTGKLSSAVSIADVLRSIVATKGLKGFYPNYRVTLMRNIPSAVIRFTMYEELRLAAQSLLAGYKDPRIMGAGYLAAGALASAFASISTTPFDVVKTRLATGVLPPGTNAFAAMRTIAAADGVAGLFVGVQARLLMSALFGGVGFASFELVKQRLGVDSPTVNWYPPQPSEQEQPRTSPKRLSRPGRWPRTAAVTTEHPSRNRR